MLSRGLTKAARKVNEMVEEFLRWELTGYSKIVRRARSDCQPVGPRHRHEIHHGRESKSRTPALKSRKDGGPKFSILAQSGRTGVVLARGSGTVLWNAKERATRRHSIPEIMSAEMQIIPTDVLLTRLARFLQSYDLPGLKTRESQSRFVEKLFNSEKRHRAIAIRKFIGSTDLHRRDFHPLKAIVQLFEAGDVDEAVWLLFLTIHFGQDVRETIRLFYAKLGVGCWRWETVKNDPESLRAWMRANRNELRKLKFGNHRKRRIMDPEHRRGTWKVIRSFLDWVEEHGQGSPRRALIECIAGARNPGDAFDRLYETLDILDFGRTAKFDLLCLLGNLRIFDLLPPHCYLRDATGPKQGALLMATGRREGRFQSEMERTIRKLTTFLGVPVETMEDALCNWQKRPKSNKLVAELGYLSTCA
jgi:hypothetical protein